MNEIDKLIKNLGGIHRYPRNENKNTMLDIISFEKENHIIFPDLFKKFMDMFAPFSFKNSVVLEINSQLSSFIHDNLMVDYFYSFKKESKVSVQKKIEDIELPEGLFPFCDGEFGDLFCISLMKESYGEIFYFHHEAINNKFIKVSNSFDDFLKKLIKEKKEEPQDISNWKMPDDVKENSTDEFLKNLENWKKKNM